MTEWTNKLYFGDNLDILRDHIDDETVDLIYIDPPFNSKASYNVLYKEHNGTPSPAQAMAFEDSWHWTPDVAAYYETMKDAMPIAVHDMLEAMHELLKGSDMMAYIVMMTPRLVELYRVLKPTGSIYVHCDQTASHYLKILMDAIFGPERFVNNIVWQRTNAKGLSFTRFATNHDDILRYSKSAKWTWNAQYTEHDPDYIEQFYRYTEPGTGRRYRYGDLTNPNKDRPNLTYEFLGVTRVWRWTRERMQEAYEKGLVVQTAPGRVPVLKRYLDEQEGTPVGDVWTDIGPIQAHSTERLGYQTQKPKDLLERVIRASSNEGDLVLDAFCGCGTTIEVAEALHRKWIGIDVTYLAIDIMQDRLRTAFGENVSPYEVYGVPVDRPGAAALFHKNPFEFQFWACRLIGATPRDHRKGKPMEAKHGGDGGIDGIIFFSDDTTGKSKRVVVSVKGGGVGAKDIRDLGGTISREGASIGVLLTLEPPTSAMIKEALDYGFYKPAVETRVGKAYPRIQILTIDEALTGKRPDLPATEETYKPGRAVSKAVRPGLFGDVDQ